MSCHICHEEGHFARECPQNSGSGDGGQGCFKCGQTGHRKSDCPNSAAGGGDGGQQGCFKCGQTGHRKSDCPNEASGGEGGQQGCFKCGDTGHRKSECPQNANEGGGDDTCRYCKLPGHQIKDCPTKPERGAGGTACHRCGQEGHFSRDCTEAPKEGEGNPGPDGKPREVYTPAEFASGDAAFEERKATHCETGINFDAYENIPVKATGNDTLLPVDRFEDMALRPLILQNIIKVGYVTPTPIQRYVFPTMANGRNLMACAQTGSGKSCAFLLPILNDLMSDNEISPPNTIPARPEALILAPTRELAVQIGKEGHLYGQHSIVATRVIYGGPTTGGQRNQIHAGCNILVATPGRLNQFLRDGHVSLDKVRYFIMDEADRMLDMGFSGEVAQIVDKLPPKENRVNGMFSATFPDEVKRTAETYLVDYIFITVGIVGGACKDVEQVFEQVERKGKRDRLLELLNTFSANEKILIFCASKKGADFLAGSLLKQNLSCTSIHGDRLQSQRETALREFTRGDRQILVATAVAARGLDIPKVAVVINYDLPSEIDEYVHRIGRTGRVGNSGKAISFFDPDKDSGIVANLKRILSDAGQNVPDWLEPDGMNGSAANFDFGGEDTRNQNGETVAVAKPQVQSSAADDEDW